MSEIAPRKQEKDYTSDVAALVPEAEKLAQEGQLQEAVDKLLALEKLTRNAADLSSTSQILTLIPTLAYKSSNLPLLNSLVPLLAKRHGQLKEAVVRMVDAVSAFLPELKIKSGVEAWLELIATLRAVTEGKIYLELPRARLTALLSKHHEELSLSAPKGDDTPAGQGKTQSAKEKEEEAKKEPVTAKDHLDRAADLLSELQVETYSSMERREKTEFILDQMRLESQRGNWTRVRVGGRKINRAYLKEEGNTDMKLRYYGLIVELALEEDAFLDACKSYQEVYDTDSIKADEVKANETLELIAYFVVLAPYDNEQSDMLHRIAIDSKYEKVPLQKELLKSFTTKELMRWPGIESVYGSTLRQSSVFSEASPKGGKRWEVLHKRVIEHNIRVVSTYYTRITLPRLSQLLDLSEAAALETLSRLVVDKTVHARIDRPAGVVDFRRKLKSEETLDEWARGLEKMLGLLEATSHLINKEYAVHAAKVTA